LWIIFQTANLSELDNMTAKVLISEDNLLAQQVFKAFFSDCETKICETGTQTIETA